MRAIPFAEIERARETIAGAAIRTPLLRLPVDGPAEIWLKLENLQPIGSFKIRGAVNAIRQASHTEAARGVVTASAGNMAQGVAWAARELGVPATIIAPEHAPQTKLDAIARLGGTVVKVPYERWWEILMTSEFHEAEGLFIHPVQDERVMAGNGTIGLELAEELPDADAVLVPWGGGGLFTGIASALAALRPGTRRLRGPARDRRGCVGRTRGGRAARGRVPALLRRRSRSKGRAAGDVGAGATRCWPAHSPPPSTRPQPPSGCSLNVHA